jgi:hypothetical protein
MDISELEHIVSYRRRIRNKLEKIVALDYATEDRYDEKTVWVPKGFYNNYDEEHRAMLDPAKQSIVANMCGYEVHSASNHYNAMLDILNKDVKQLQDTIVDHVKADVHAYRYVLWCLQPVMMHLAMLVRIIRIHYF